MFVLKGEKLILGTLTSGLSWSHKGSRRHRADGTLKKTFFQWVFFLLARPPTPSLMKKKKTASLTIGKVTENREVTANREKRFTKVQNWTNTLFWKKSLLLCNLFYSILCVLSSGGFKAGLGGRHAAPPPLTLSGLAWGGNIAPPHIMIGSQL